MNFSADWRQRNGNWGQSSSLSSLPFRINVNENNAKAGNNGKYFFPYFKLNYSIVFYNLLMIVCSIIYFNIFFALKDRFMKNVYLLVFILKKKSFLNWITVCLFKWLNTLQFSGWISWKLLKTLTHFLDMKCTSFQSTNAYTWNIFWLNF